MNAIFEALALLTPYDIDIPKRRIGPQTDGGYILADCIDPAQSILSYGISTEYRFDCEMALAGHKVFMFDHTISGIEQVSENMMWFREGVGGRSRPADSMFTIEDHLSNKGIQGDRLILKMDVEGYEYEAIGATPEDVLARFEQIVIEIHNLAHLPDGNFRKKFMEVIRKFNRMFTLFHVHANNYDGPDAFHCAGGLPVPNLLELSYIKTAKVSRRQSQTLYPTALDYPNTNQKDKLLWIYPFIPTTADTQQFALCQDRVELIAANIP